MTTGIVTLMTVDWDEGQRQLSFNGGPMLGTLRSEELRWLAQEMAREVVALLNHADMLDGRGVAPPPVEPTNG